MFPMAAVISLDTSPYLPAPAQEDDYPSHCTLLYLGDVTSDSALPLARLAEYLGTYGDLVDDDLHVLPGGHAVFDTPDGFAAVALLDAPAFPRLRVTLENMALSCGLSLPAAHGFVPHATLAYFSDDSPARLLGETARERAHRYAATAPSLPPEGVTFAHLHLRVNGVAAEYEL